MFSSQIGVPDWLVPGLILLLVGGVLAVIVRAIFRGFQEWTKGWFENILAEVKPNGGKTQSLGDTARRVEDMLSEHIKQDLQIQTDFSEALRKQGENTASLREVLDAFLTGMQTNVK